MKKRTRYILCGVVVIGIALYSRLTGLNWDQGSHLHPDERFIVMTVENLHWPDKLNPNFFAYGSLPLYLLKFVGFLGSFINPEFATFDKINLLGRVLSSIFDIGTLILIALIIKTIAKDVKIAILAAIWYACSVLPIQLSHFYAVDTLLTFFITATLYVLILYAAQSTRLRTLGIGVCFGLAIATKISAVLLLVPIGMTMLFLFRSRRKHFLIQIPLIGISALITFFMCQPFAFLDFATFSRQIMEQQAMTKNAFVFPYTLQYVGKIPYWYEIKNIFLWGQGPILASISFLGIVYGTHEAIRKKCLSFGIILSFFWIYFFTVGKFAIGFMRYMLPVYPILTIFAAILFNKITHVSKLRHNSVLYIIVTIGIVIWALSFQTIYQTPNTRSLATDWMLTYIPRGSSLALEHWDDRLPLRYASQYAIHELPLYDPDTRQKWMNINMILDKTEYIVIASNRLYVPLMKMTNCDRLPDGRCYRKTATYYKQLFDGSLGFKKIAEFSSYPTIPLLNIPIDDSSADESFTVYDHPKILIFQKTEAYRPMPLEE